MKNGITVAYSGVHQAYQLALAAEELGQLNYFYCSLYAGSDKWGGALERLLGSDKLINRRVEGLPPHKARENPWPLLAHRFRAKLRPSTANDWVAANNWFDRWVAQRLKRGMGAIFVGVETCAMRSFHEAKRLGGACLLDCPQMHPTFLERVYREAGVNLGMTIPVAVDNSRMAARKSWEFQNADFLLTPSEVAQRSFIEAGFPKDRVIVTPLWADSKLWFPEHRRNSDGPLRVLFVGSLSWRKGIPYLLEAARSCGRDVRLTLVGPKEPELESYLAKNADLYKWVEPQTKQTLRRIYCDHDVLALPSLADTFGFAALEAMACGTPIIVSENCGVPTPDPSWRVPIMDSAAIARRLQHYIKDRGALRHDGQKALLFAAQFTPERYRAQIKEIYLRLLEAAS
jgi:glycosyltransferase involved in cell wall biosynthesis